MRRAERKNEAKVRFRISRNLVARCRTSKGFSHFFLPKSSRATHRFETIGASDGSERRRKSIMYTFRKVRTEATCLAYFRASLPGPRRDAGQCAAHFTNAITRVLSEPRGARVSEAHREWLPLAKSPPQTTFRLRRQTCRACRMRASAPIDLRRAA